MIKDIELVVLLKIQDKLVHIHGRNLMSCMLIKGPFVHNIASNNGSTINGALCRR
jgi:hypothetical protein